MSTPIEKSFRVDAEVLKVDSKQGLVFGWGIICTEDGNPYVDLQGDHIPEGSMLKAAADFMLTQKRGAKEMHSGDDTRGQYVFAFPMTADVAKAFGVTTKRTGLMLGLKPDDSMLKDFESGKLRGFSIGGVRITDKEVGTD